MPSRPRPALVLLLPAALLALGLYVRGLAEGAFAAFTDYESPFSFPSEPAAAKARPMSGRVVLVLLDGLGIAPSREMKNLGELRAAGADYVAQIGLPSLSQPGRAVLLSGAWQEVHGQATNFKPRPLKVEHLFQVVRRAGGTTALSGMGDGVHKLFEPHVQQKLAFGEPPETAELSVYEAKLGEMAVGARQVAASDTRLAMAELVLVDEAGHNWGGASPEYATAVQAVDEELGRLRALLDPATTTLVVTADHGHVPAGGHGGPEPTVMEVPLVLSGAGIRPGASGRATQADLASTLALLLGVDIPSANQGRPLLDALQLDAEGRLAALRRVHQQRSSFVRRYAALLRGGPAGQVAPLPAQATEAEVNAALDALDAVAEQARTERMALDARVRSRLSMALAGLPLVVFAVLLATRTVRAGELLTGLACGGLGVLVYHLLLAPLGLGYSFSAVNKDSNMEAFFLRDMILGAACCALGVAAGAALARRAGALRGPWDAARVGWLASAGFCYALVLKIAFVYWRHGVFLQWHMPDMYWSFGFYLDALALMAAAFAAPFLPLVAWAVGALGRREPAEVAHAA
jgi:hypothetical protein